MALSTVELASAAPHAAYPNAPQAVYDPTTERTYVAYLGLARSMYVTYYDHDAATVATPVRVGHPYPLAADNDHGSPCLDIDDRGHIHIVWGSHVRVHYYVKSKEPASIDSWWNHRIETPGTYPTFHLVGPAGFMTDRAGAAHGSVFPVEEFAGLRTTANYGGNWSPTQALIDTTGSPESVSDAYIWATAYHNDRLYFCWSVARGSVHDDVRTNIYAAYYDSGTCYTVGGSSLGSTIDWTDHSSCLVATHDYIGIPTLTVDDAGIAVAYSWGVDGGGSGTHRLNVAFWDGSTWTDTNISTNGTDTGQTWPTVWKVSGGWRGVFPISGDLVVFDSVDGVSWIEDATFLSQSVGEGYGPTTPVRGSGPGVALTQQHQTGFVNTSATAPDLLPLLMIVDTEAPVAPPPTSMADVTCEFSSAFSTAFAICVEPDAPTNPAAAAQSCSTISVTWDDVADETGYGVERSLDGSTGWADVSGNLDPDSTSYLDTGLSESTQYFYRVFAFNAVGDSDPSVVVNDSTPACPTPPPSGGSNRMGGDKAIRRSPTRPGR